MIREHKNCFIVRPSSGSGYPFLRKKIGIYLGMKADVWTYNPRGVLSSIGFASEGGFYLDADKIYQEARKEYKTL